MILIGIALCFQLCNAQELDRIITVRRGYQAILPCHYNFGSGSPTLKWNKRNGDHYTLLTTNTFVHYYIGKIFVQSIASNEMNLNIPKVTEEFSGQYRCTAHENGSNIIVVNVTLIIEIPPKIDISRSSAVNTTVMEHHDLKLSCIATGTPTPVVSWYRGKNGYTNDIGVTGNTLIIRNVSIYATNVYTCIVKNSVGSDMRAINVIVNSTIEVLVMEKSIYVRSYNEVSMACMVRGSPLSKAYWIDKHGDEMKTNWKHNVSEELAGDGIPIRFLTLILFQTTKEDYGIYTCQADDGTFIKNATVELKSSERQEDTSK